MIVPDFHSSSHSAETPPTPERQAQASAEPDSLSQTSTASTGMTTGAQSTINFDTINITNALNNLLLSPWYVGNPNLSKNVKWLVTGNTSTLVRADNEEQAEIEFMGQIDSKDTTFSLYVDGGWKPAFRNKTPFASVKARGRLIKPERTKWEPVAQIWNAQINGLQALQNTKKTKGAAPVHTLVDNDGAIKLRHIVFEDTRLKSKQATDVDSDDELEDLDENSPFHMKQWPCTTPEAREELDKIIDEGIFKGNVIPAYHMGDGDNLIEPSDYRKCLSGALVLVKASITFQNIGGSSKQGEDKQPGDSWYAEIREIRVISPPLPPPTSPAKRRAKQAIRNQQKKIRQT